MSRSESPSNHVFINAKQYLEIARIAHDSGNLSDVSIAAVSNYAFSAELMLKAFDTTLLPSISVEGRLLSEAEVKTNLRGHNLKVIYNKLPINVREKLKAKFLSVTGKEIDGLLDACSDYFVLSRYYHEPKSKVVYRISDVRDLAEGIEKALNDWNNKTN